jgi:type I restriction enzyme S subunit
MIPEGWTQFALSEIAASKIVYGIVQAGPHVPDGVPYLKSSDIGGKIDVSNLQKTAPEIHARYRRSAVRPGDIVISLRGNTGETSIVPLSLPEANLTQGTARIAVAAEFDSDFIYHQIASSAVQRRIHSATKGSTFVEITLDDLRKVELLCPASRCEQRRVAEILSTWDRAIETVEALIANARAQKKALMQSLLTGKKRLPGFSGDWERTSFGELFDLKIGGTPSRSNHTFWDSTKSTENVWVAISDLTGKYILETSEHISNEGVRRSNVKLLPSGTVIMSFKLSIGRRAILTRPAYTNEAICALLPKQPDKVSSIFVYHALELVDFTASVDQAVKGQTLNKAKLAELRLRLPLRREQDRIAEVLEDADHELHKLAAQLAALRQEKSALMQQLLTGKRRVKVDQREAA